MKQTQHFQLSQWAKDDRIRREDFNGDNLKIESALKTAGQSELIKIHYHNPPYVGIRHRVMIDMSDIDWDAWEIVYLISTYFDVTDTKDTNFFVFETRPRGNCVFSYGNEVTTILYKTYRQPFVFAFLPGHDKSRPINYMFLGNPSGAGNTEITFDQLTEFHIRAHPDDTSPLDVPSTWEVRGIR